MLKGLLVWIVVLVSTYSSASTGPKQSLSDASTQTALTALFELIKHSPPHMSYRGVFTFQQKDNPSLQSFRIEQWQNNEGVRYERLLLLNGPSADILRQTQVACNDQGVSVGRASSLMTMNHLSNLYTFELRGAERVAGRHATAVLAIPKDSHRHSTLFSVDNDTGLILKRWLVDAEARALERVQFVDLTILSSDQKPYLQKEEGQHHGVINAGCEIASDVTVHPWIIGWVPAGFILHQRKQLEEGIDMLMYSDGLTSFSIFVEKTDALPLEGVAQRGATLAAIDGFVDNQSSYRVAVVGEIPSSSAQRIASEVSLHTLPSNDSHDY